MDLGDLNAGILVRKGTVNLVNCKIFVANQRVIQLGIVVLPGAKLIIQSTIFVGLGTAIGISKNGEVVMNGCSFKECMEGIQVVSKILNSSTAFSKIAFKNCLTIIL